MTYLDSWYVHDFKWCCCGSSFVDGGDAYARYGGKNLSDIVLLGKSLPYRLEE
jgi:hypothetical protein